MIDKQEILHIAKLSRLEFNNTDIENFEHDLNAIVDYVNQLQQVNTNNVLQPLQPINAETELRQDTPREYFTQEQSVANAPAKKYGAFSVPTVIE